MTIMVVNKQGLSDQVYGTLKQQILDQQIAPGARLNINMQAKTLGVSSTPVREALNRLVAERLVISEHYSGYRVAPPIGVRFVNDLLDYRIVIEGHCALTGAPKATRSTLQAMAAAHRKMANTERIGTRYEEYRQFVAADNAFHELIVDCAGNQVMSEHYRSLNAINLQSRLYLHRSGGANSEEVIGEHKRILEAFENKDGVAARDAIVSHLEGGRRRLSGLSR